jgi:hypothetical protein
MISTTSYELSRRQPQESPSRSLAKCLSERAQTNRVEPCRT